MINRVRILVGLGCWISSRFLRRAGPRKTSSLAQSPGAHPGGVSGCLSSVGLTASRPSFLFPIGFHLPEGRRLRASRPVNQGRRAPPLPSRGFITGIPMAQALASNLLPLRPGQAERTPHTDHTLALQLPSCAVHDRAPRPQPLPVCAARPPPRGPRGKEGRKAGAAVRPAEPATPARSRLPGPAGTMLPARCVRLLTPHLLLVLVQLSPTRGHRTTGPRVSAPSRGSTCGGRPRAGEGEGRCQTLSPDILPNTLRAFWRSCLNKHFPILHPYPHPFLQH